MRPLVIRVCKFASFFSLLLLICPSCFAEFPGWQGLRVIEQKGRPSLMRAADLDGDGREELVVVNSRSSRLDIYAWRDPTTETADDSFDDSRPNELPLAADLKHSELQLEHVPRDVLIRDLDDNGQPELVVLVTSPNQVVVYHYADDQWQREYDIDLLSGSISSRRSSMLIRMTDEDQPELLVSMDNGIQQLALEPGGRARWFAPREKRGRLSWWLSDLDGDGREDLVEQSRESDESIRWYQAAKNGDLAPAAVIHDRAVKDVEVLESGSKTELALIDGTVSGILRRYELSAGEKSPFGQRRPLALEDGMKAVWCGIRLGEQRALVVADSQAPRLLCYQLSEAGWQTEQAYPALTDIQALESLAAEPGTLLLWTKDAADLRRSRWQSERLSYPEPWPQSADVEDRKILALDSVGAFTWWAQKVGKDLDLYVASPESSEPQRTRFAGVGNKVDEVLWIGGDRLLVKETHGRALKLVELDGEKARATSPTHLKKASLADFKLFVVGDQVRLGRLTDGVLQWLGDDLRSQEQIMLPQGQKLADYVATSETDGWALQADSPYAHRIKIDDSRLSRSVERVKVADGNALVDDPVLGMLLVGADRVTHLSEGRPYELQLIDVIDERVARSGGVKKTRFHRLSTSDIDRDGYEDLILFDELQHRLTVLGEDDSADGTLQPKISWPVFDDKIYPYNDESDNLVKEPRAVLAADFDGDQLQDLAILCHDRLIIYLAREQS